MLEKALISGVTHTLDETLFRVEDVSAARLFEALAEASVNVDTVAQTGDELVFSAGAADVADAERALNQLGVPWSSRDDLGQVSIVGAGMRSHPGVAAKAFSTLEGLGVEPQIITTSPIKIACFVPRSDVERAVQSLHAAFELDSAEAERQHA